MWVLRPTLALAKPPPVKIAPSPPTRTRLGLAACFHLFLLLRVSGCQAVTRQFLRY